MNPVSSLLLLLACGGGSLDGRLQALLPDTEQLRESPTRSATPVEELGLLYQDELGLGLVEAQGAQGQGLVGGEGALLSALRLEDGTLLVATDRSLFAGVEELRESPLTAELSGVTQLGLEGRTVWLGADQGLVRWHDGALSRPLRDGEPLTGSFAVHEGLWALSGHRLVRLEEGRVVDVGERGEQLAVAGGALWVAQGRSLASFDGRWSSWRVDGPVEALLGGGSSLWVITEEQAFHLDGAEAGVMERPSGRLAVDGLGRLVAADDDGLWRFTVGHPVGLVGLREGGTLEARTRVELVLTHPELVQELALSLDGVPLAVEDGGVTLDPLQLSSGEVHRLELRVDYPEGPSSAGLSFRVAERGEVSWVDDIEPLYEDNCARCHGGSTETLLDSAEAWEAHHDRILEMVGSGAMPIGADPLSDAQQALIASWAEGGFR